MKPVRVAVDVPRPRAEVYDFLDVMANHRAFNDHFMVDWQLSGPERGVGSRARVRTRVAGGDVVDIHTVSAGVPATIVEQNVGAGGRRHGTGTYTLEELPGGGTRVLFEYAWRRAPLSERIAAPLVRAYMRRQLTVSMRRLADLLGAADPAGAAPGADAGRHAAPDADATR